MPGIPRPDAPRACRRAEPAMATKPAMHAARRLERSRTDHGDKPSPTLRFLFPFIFNRSKSLESESSAPQMLPSNRRYADTTKIPLPRLSHRPTRRPLHHRGPQTFTCHTPGGVRMIDWFASQDLSPSPQPQAEKGLTHAQVTHSTSGFCVTTPPVADGPAAYQIPGVTPTSLTGNCNFPAYRS